MAPKILIVIMFLFAVMAIAGIILAALLAAIGYNYFTRRQAAAERAQAGSRVQDYGLGARAGFGIEGPGAPDTAVSEWVLRDSEGRLVGYQRQSVGKCNGATPAAPVGNGGPPPAPAPPPPPNP